MKIRNVDLDDVESRGVRPVNDATSEVSSHCLPSHNHIRSIKNRYIDGFGPVLLVVILGFNPLKTQHRWLHSIKNTQLAGIVPVVLLCTLDLNHVRSPTVLIRSIKKRNIAGYVPVSLLCTLSHNHKKSANGPDSIHKKTQHRWHCLRFLAKYTGSRPYEIRQRF